MLDDKTEKVREAVKELYLKEKRSRENFRFFIDMYRTGAISKDILFALLPSEDAESIIIGTKAGRDAAEIAKELGY